MMKRLLLLPFFFLCLAACSPVSRQSVGQAEQLLDSRPDSALFILQQLSADDLYPRGLRARYAVLLTAAQYKNYIEVQSDSLIGPAYDYYHRYGTMEKRMKAAYYLGVVKQNAGKAVEASYLFNETSALAEQLADRRFLGFAYDHLSVLYSENFDTPSAYEYARKAVQAFDAAGERLSADYARLDMARTLQGMGRMEPARRIVDSLVTASEVTDSYLRYYLYALKADFSYLEEHYAEAEQLYRQAEACGYPLGLSGQIRLAVIMEMMGRHAEADSCMNAFEPQLRSSVDSTIYFGSVHRIGLHRGDVNMAYRAILETSELQNRAVASQLTRSITHSQRAYFEERYASERQQKWMIVLICALVAVSLLTVILIAFILLRKRKMQVVEEMEKVEGLSQDLQLLQEKQKGAGAVLSSLVQDKIRLMQKLTDSYFSWTDEALYVRERTRGKAMKEDVISEFRSTLRTLRNDEQFIPSLEKTLDISNRNLMTRLREIFSTGSEHKMKDMDFKLLTLFFAGFTPKSISFIMDMTEESVRTRKSRYKKLFLSLGEDYSEFAGRLN
ncbi:MAG: hypothetical protein IKQ76_00310 [Bacteroidales bacterium]|nr:hypothetical protein [Bacteroidales bacterium]